MGGREKFEALAAGVAMMGCPIEVSELVALVDEGRTPMVIDPAQAEGQLLRARSLIDLHAAHVGRQVLLAFVGGDPTQPVVLGLLHGDVSQPLQAAPGQVQMDVDGERLVIKARQQLVLRCGKASITLTQSGKVLIEGAYVLSRSSGVNRLKGGSVQIN